MYNRLDVLSAPEMHAYKSRMMQVLREPLPLVDDEANELAPRRMHLTSGAERLWLLFHDEVELLQGSGRKYSDVQSSASKAAEQAVRLAGVITLLDDLHTREISAAAMEAGIELAQFHLGEALRLHQGTQLDPELVLAAKVLAWGLKRPGRKFSLVELYQNGLAEVRKAARARAIMKILVAHGKARPVPDGVIYDGTLRREAFEVRP